jgi:hypothetical protein
MRVSAAEKAIKENLDYSKIDRECANLCRAINEIPGICTIESCSGHGKWEFQVYFFVTHLSNLSLLLGCIHGMDDWAVYVYAVYYGDWPKFILTGPTGDFKTAERLAKEIRREKMLILRDDAEKRKGRKSKRRHSLSG